MGQYVVRSGGITEKITLDKFAHTINNVYIDKDGWAGPFYYNSYILMPNPFLYTHSFDIVLNIKLTQNVTSSSVGGLCGAISNWFHAPSIEIQSMNFIWAGFSYAGTIWDKGLNGNYNFELNTEYYIKYSYNAIEKNLSLSISKNDKEYTIISTASNVSYGYQNTSKVFSLGSVNSTGAGTSSHRLEYGKLNIRKSYILIDEGLFWGINYGYFKQRVSNVIKNYDANNIFESSSLTSATPANAVFLYDLSSSVTVDNYTASQAVKIDGQDANGQDVHNIVYGINFKINVENAELKRYNIYIGVSSEGGSFDVCYIDINGTRFGTYSTSSGTLTKHHIQAFLKEGENTILIQYRKDGSSSKGDDCVYIYGITEESYELKAVD